MGLYRRTESTSAFFGLESDGRVVVLRFLPRVGAAVGYIAAAPKDGLSAAAQLHMGDRVVLAEGVPLAWPIKHSWSAVEGLDGEASKFVRDLGLVLLDRRTEVPAYVVGREGTARVRVAIEESETLGNGHVIPQLLLDVPIQALQHAKPQVGPRSFTFVRLGIAFS